MNKFLIFTVLMCLSIPLLAQSDQSECVAAFEEKEYRTAFDCLNEYLEKQPDDVVALYYRARIWQVIEFYEEAIELEDDDVRMYMERGRLYREKLNEPVLAEQDLRSVLDLDIGYRESCNERQFALFFLGDVQKAVQWQNAILNYFPTNWNYYNAARIYSLSGRKQEALAFLRMALEKGFSNISRMENDGNLETVRELQGFVELVNK